MQLFNNSSSKRPPTHRCCCRFQLLILLAKLHHLLHQLGNLLLVLGAQVFEGACCKHLHVRCVYVRCFCCWCVRASTTTAGRCVKAMHRPHLLLIGDCHLVAHEPPLADVSELDAEAEFLPKKLQVCLQLDAAAACLLPLKVPDEPLSCFCGLLLPFLAVCAFSF